MTLNDAYIVRGGFKTKPPVDLRFRPVPGGCHEHLNAHLRIFSDLQPVIRFNITWLSINRMEVFMYTKW